MHSSPLGEASAVHLRSTRKPRRGSQRRQSNFAIGGIVKGCRCSGHFSSESAINTAGCGIRTPIGRSLAQAASARHTARLCRWALVSRTLSTQSLPPHRAPLDWITPLTMRPQRTRRPTDKSREAALQQENTWRGPKRHAAAQPAYPHPQQRTRRGGLGGTAAAADPAPRAPSASASESSEDEAQAALLQLAALAVGEELEDEEEQEQQQQQEQPAGAPTARVQHPPVEHLPPPPQALLRCPIQPPQTVQQKQEHVKPQEQQQEQPGASPTAAAVQHPRTQHPPAAPMHQFCPRPVEQPAPATAAALQAQHAPPLLAPSPPVPPAPQQAQRELLAARHAATPANARATAPGDDAAFTAAAVRMC